jgi:L-ascorbate metabolism protein UlaG (beta-lactamase superfamily)
MFELTFIGHATLLVRSNGAAILCDPILGEAACGGGNVFLPRRTVHADQFPALDAILISHHHSDHFSLPDLAQIPGIRTQRILAPERSEVIDELRQFGCTGVEALHVGRPVEIGGITVIPTPSSVEFPEVGFLFRSGSTTILSLVDTQIHGVIDQLQRIIAGHPVHLALVPFQAGGYMSLLPLRIGGPPDGLVEAISRWSLEYTEELAADLSLIKPQYVTPFADGLVYREKGINAWHFPLSDDTFLERMASIGIQGGPSNPGSVFVVSSSGVETRIERAVVTAEPNHDAERSFDPSVRLSDMPMTCANWNPALRFAANGLKLDDLCIALRDKVAANVTERAVTAVSWQDDHLFDWFLEFCDHPDGMNYLFIDLGTEGLQVRLGVELPPSREYGLRLHAADLLALMEGRIHLEHITLGGAFRYHSPRAIDDLERIRGRVFGPLYTILGMK